MTCETSPSRSSSICVIFNPAAGRRRARQRLEAISTGWLSNAELWPTERRGHAEELARRAAASGFGIVAAAGGDGTVHEVANGVLKAGRPEVCFAVIPLGSADDYACTASRIRTTAPALIRLVNGSSMWVVCESMTAWNAILSAAWASASVRA